MPPKIRGRSDRSINKTSWIEATTTPASKDNEEASREAVVAPPSSSTTNDDPSSPECPLSEDHPSTSPAPASVEPIQLFQPRDHVIARDTDGVLYHAVVRRALYGRGRAEQIQLGLYSPAEAEQLLQQQKQEQQDPDGGGSWFYFVHFNKWRPNFDSWVRDCDVYPVNEATEAYAARISTAHKELRRKMASGQKKGKAGKKMHQMIDGNKFLKEWRQQVMTIDAEFNIRNPRFGSHATAAPGLPPDNNANNSNKEEEKDGSSPTQGEKRLSQKQAQRQQKQWQEEITLRRTQSLTKRSFASASSSQLSLSFGLKKALVEQWEIITQCGMLAQLPSAVPIRQALDGYLRSKGVVDPSTSPQIRGESGNVDDNTKAVVVKDTTGVLPSEPSLNESTTTHSNVTMDAAAHDNNRKDDVFAVALAGEEEKTDEDNDNDAKMVESSSDQANSVTRNIAAVDLPLSDTGDKGLDPAVAATSSASKSDHPSQDDDEDGSADEAQGWIDMANGIAQFFDEALPHSLLYLEEYPQLRVIDRSPELEDKRYSEIYGCEYLLRLFTRLPELLEEEFTPEQSRSLYAKLNDFTRYLHKNQSFLLAAHHRKPNREEHAEASRMEARQQKKLLREAAALLERPAKKPKLVSPPDADGKEQVEGEDNSAMCCSVVNTAEPKE